jgi:FlaG/FlaF family flagellin (archaellin)
MSLPDILDDETAVSPVVGVALLIGITVLMVAAVSTFVLGTDVRQQPPDVEFSAEERLGADDKIERVVFTFRGNENLRKENVRVVFDAEGYQAQIDGPPLDSGTFNASEEFEVTFTGSGPDATGSAVRIVWSPEGESRAETIRKHTVTRDVTT